MEVQNKTMPDPADVKRTLLEFEAVTSLFRKSQEMLRNGKPNEAVKFLIDVQCLQLSVNNDFTSTMFFKEYMEVRRELIVKQGRSALLKYRMQERQQRILSLVDTVRAFHGVARVDTQALQRSVNMGTSYIYAEKSSQFEKDNRYAHMLDEQQAVAIEATLERTSDLYIFMKEEDSAHAAFPIENEKYTFQKFQCEQCLRISPTERFHVDHIRTCKSSRAKHAIQEWHKGRTKQAMTACRRLLETATLDRTRIDDIGQVLEKLHEQSVTCEKEAPEVVCVVSGCIALLKCMRKLLEEREIACKRNSKEEGIKWSGKEGEQEPFQPISAF